MLLLTSFRRRANEEENLEQRLATFVERPKTLEEIEMDAPFGERVLQPIIGSLSRAVGRMTPAKRAEKLRLNLAIAGNPNGMQTTDFLGMQGTVAVLLAGVTVMLMILSKQPLHYMIIGGLLMAFIGYELPVYWLSGKMKKRKQIIQRALPDCIDLLTISVEAGLGFDQALDRVAGKWDNELCREFRRVLSEMRVGKAKRDALREMAARSAVQDVGVFVSSIIQADQLGVSMSKVLRIQSDQMRIRRRQLAEKKAHEAPIKMIFPMVFLIFPTIYIVILGPAVPTIAASFGYK